MRLNIAKTVFAAVLLMGAAPANASAVHDAPGDYLATYFGSKTGDLDVISASVTYNPASDIFHFESTFAGNLGGSPLGYYIWGFDRGAGSGRFTANGLPQVLFDSVVRFNMDGGGVVSLLTPTSSTTAFAAGTAKIKDNQLIADIAASLLPSNGLAKSSYTWNLWPRDGALPAGFGQISDFAPDAINAPVQVVPLPGAFWLFGSMFAMFKLVGNSKQRFAVTVKSIQ